MVSLLVLGVIIAIAVPSFTSVSLSSLGRSATLDLQTAVSVARQEAIKSHTTTTLCPVNTSEDGCLSDSSDWSNGWIVGRGDGTISTVVRVWQPKSNDRLSVTAIGSNSFTFSNSGRASSSGSFSVVAGTSSDNGYYLRCVGFSLMGQSYATEPDGDSCP